MGKLLTSGTEDRWCLISLYILRFKTEVGMDVLTGAVICPNVFVVTTLFKAKQPPFLPFDLFPFVKLWADTSAIIQFRHRAVCSGDSLTVFAACRGRRIVYFGLRRPYLRVQQSSQQEPKSTPQSPSHWAELPPSLHNDMIMDDRDICLVPALLVSVMQSKHNRIS